MRCRVLSALLFAAITLAAGLSSATQLHEWLHEISQGSNHECAATLLSSGRIEHSDCEPASTASSPAPNAPVFRTQLLPRVLAFLGFARLEHAPPFFS